MLLSIEYLLRHRLVEDMVEYPFSLFLEGAERVSITFDKESGRKITVRRYWIDRTDPNKLIPPCENFQLKESDIFTDDRTCLKGFWPIFDIGGSYEYRYDPVPKFTEGLIEQDEYKEIAYSLLNSRTHQICKYHWLWVTFNDLFLNNKCVYEHDIRKDKYLWFHWSLWKVSLMPESKTSAKSRGIAGELAFTPAYLNQD